MTCISNVRVDHRLVHGQILLSWIPYYDIDSIIVCNDELANDPVKSEMMGCCIPPEIRIEMVSIEEITRRSKEGSENYSKTIFLFENLKDTYRAYRAGFRFSTLNIGNLPSGSGRKRVTPSVYLGREDIEIIHFLIDQGVNIDVRSVYSEKPLKIEKIYALEKELE